MCGRTVQCLGVLRSVRRRPPGFLETSSSGIKQEDAQATELLHADILNPKPEAPNPKPLAPSLSWSDARA